jgi:hypothetical protein
LLAPEELLEDKGLVATFEELPDISRFKQTNSIRFSVRLPEFPVLPNEDSRLLDNRSVKLEPCWPVGKVFVGNIVLNKFIIN